MKSGIVVRKNVMRQTRLEAPAYRDKLTGEISCTGLAECVCDSMNGYDENNDIPEEFFEAAYLVAEESKGKPTR